MAQALLHSWDQKPAIPPHLRELIRMPKQRQECVRDDVCRRLVARHHHLEGEGGQLTPRKMVTTLVGLHERGQHVVARESSSLLGQRLEVRTHLERGGVRDLELPCRTARLEQWHEPMGPLDELRAVRLGCADHRADHLQRKRVREIGDYVHRAEARDPLRPPRHAQTRHIA